MPWRFCSHECAEFQVWLSGQVFYFLTKLARAHLIIFALLWRFENWDLAFYLNTTWLAPFCSLTRQPCALIRQMSARAEVWSPTTLNWADVYSSPSYWPGHLDPNSPRAVSAPDGTLMNKSKSPSHLITDRGSNSTYSCKSPKSINKFLCTAFQEQRPPPRPKMLGLNSYNIHVFHFLHRTYILHYVTS